MTVIDGAPELWAFTSGLIILKLCWTEENVTYSPLSPPLTLSLRLFLICLLYSNLYPLWLYPFLWVVAYLSIPFLLLDVISYGFFFFLAIKIKFLSVALLVLLFTSIFYVLSYNSVAFILFILKYFQCLVFNLIK